MLLSLIFVLSCMLILLEPVLSFPLLGNTSNLVIRNNPSDAVGPKVSNDFDGNEDRAKLHSAFSDAIDMVNVLLDAARNDRDFFMSVYDKYFPRDQRDQDNPHPRVMGWSSLSYIYLMNINMYTSAAGLPKMKLTLLYVPPISRDLRKYCW